MRLVFSSAADADLLNLLQTGFEQFGKKASAAYEHSFRDAFRFISEHPFAVRERHTFRPPLRIHPCGSHAIIYRIIDDTVVIIRIRHGREDWAIETEQ